MNPFIVILILNSILIIGLILNQNDTTKDALSTQSSTTLQNPLERITWFSLGLQCYLIVVKIKSYDF